MTAYETPQAATIKSFNTILVEETGASWGAFTSYSYSKIQSVGLKYMELAAVAATTASSILGYQ